MTEQGSSTGREGAAHQDGPEVGSVAEEAAKLFGALNDWATQSGGSQAGAAAKNLAEGIRSAGDHVGHGEDCRYCPVCQGIRMIRETSPEVRENLAVAIGALAQAATAALRQGSAPRDDSDQHSAPTRVDLDD